jgi:hypothetical protein
VRAGLTRLIPVIEYQSLRTTSVLVVPEPPPAENKAEAGQGGTSAVFQKGQSGNPKGRVPTQLTIARAPQYARRASTLTRPMGQVDHDREMGSRVIPSTRKRSSS